MNRATRAWLAFIRRTLNRLTLRLARAGVGHFWVIRTTGRKSGLIRETPIMVAQDPDGFVIELTYGPEVQWYRNLVAAGGGVLERGGRRWEVGAPERLPMERGIAAFPPAQQRVLHRLRREHYELLSPTGRTWTRVGDRPHHGPRTDARTRIVPRASGGLPAAGHPTSM